MRVIQVIRTNNGFKAYTPWGIVNKQSTEELVRMASATNCTLCF
jgi:hypothetical protein